MFKKQNESRTTSKGSFEIERERERERGTQEVKKEMFKKSKAVTLAWQKRG